MESLEVETLRKLSVILITVFCGYQGIAQVSRSPVSTPMRIYAIKGDYYFDHHNYAVAISYYSKFIKRNPKDVHVALRMAEASHKMGNDDLAGHWYSKALSMDPGVEESYILDYLSILNAREEYDEVKRWMAVYHDRVSKKYAGEGGVVYKDTTWLLLSNLKTLNSARSETGLALYNDRLLFSSDRTTSGDGNHNLYWSTLSPGGQYGEPISLHEVISSGAGEGPMAVAQKQGKLFFTGTGPSQGDIKALAGVFSCNIPSGRSDQVRIDKVEIKNFNHSMEHPAVSSDGTVMFFTSRDPENNHGSDLYRTEFNGKKWSTPRALGSTINSHKDELYPVLHHDSILYFASNGHEGLGGLDIYKVNVLAKNARVQHLAAPVNSPADDFGLTFNSNGSEGYLVSNRPGGLGSDDLYRFYVLPVKKAVSGAGKEDLYIYTSKGEEIRLTGRMEGDLAFEFIPGISYNLITEYDNYKTGTTKSGGGNKTALPKRNSYAFYIQQLNGTGSDEKSSNAKIRDIHVNPGDLITFQMIPNRRVADDEEGDSKIRFNRNEVTVGNNDTIVFSYVADQGPEAPGTDNSAPIASLNAGKVDPPKDVKPADVVASAKPVLAKNTPKTNTEPVAGGGKAVQPVLQPERTPEEIAPVVAVTAPAPVNKLEASQVAAVKPAAVSTPPLPPVADDHGTAEAAENNDFQYRVQIAASKSAISDAQLKKIYSGGKEIRFFKEAGYYKYYIEQTSSYPVAQKTLKESGVANGFITAYKGDTKVNLNEAVALQKKELPQSPQQSPEDKNTEPVTVSNISNKVAEPLPQSAAPSLASHDPAPDSTENIDFQFRVQIAASKSKLSDAQLKKIYNGPRETRYFMEGGYYKYHIGETTDYYAAKQILRESNVSSAFISAYKGTTKWPLQDAVASQHKAHLTRK